MAFNDLHKLKKIEKVTTRTIECDHLVVGNDIFTLEASLIINQLHPEDKLAILFKGGLDADNLALKGPNAVRGADQLNKIIEVKPVLQVETDYPETVYFKDLKLKTFTGRGKSEKLLLGEEFYTSKRMSFRSNELFNILKQSSSLEILKGFITPNNVLKILKEEGFWLVHCLNGDIFKSLHLYWGDGPWNFLQLYENKNELTDKFIQFSEATKTPCSLLIRLEFDGLVTDLRETIFVPLSYTHEWGHFIGEFQDVSDNGKQVAEFVHFIDKDHSSEDEVSRKMRIFKKNLEKIIPQIKKIHFSEFISFNEKSYSSSVDDEGFRNDKEPLKQMKFFGYNAPLSSVHASGDDISHLLRSVLSLEELRSI